jgi:two-component system sensor histidine kinase GlrK
MAFSDFWQPRSLKRLVLVAFLLLLTPLGFILYKTTDVLDTQLSLSYQQTQIALELSQQSSMLERYAEDITRTTNQYRILESETLEERLSDQITNFLNALKVQTFISEGDVAVDRLQTLLTTLESDPMAAPVDDLSVLTRELGERNHEKLNERFQELQDKYSLTRKALWLQTGGLVLATVVLIWIFSILISRPVAGLIERIKLIGQRKPLPKQPLKGPIEITQLASELHWLENELGKLEKSKSEFLRHISHELKTPLTTLREGSDLLEEEIPGPLTPQQAHVVSLIKKSSINLQRLIEQLLDYNQMQQAYIPVTQPVDLAALTRNAISAHQLLILEKKLTVTLPPTYPAIESDPTMIQRVLNNLISNAVYYTDANGQIGVGTKIDRDTLMLDVSNSGHPISEEDITRIFEPFYQGSKRRSGSLKGTGIGLSIARDAARSMKGDLDLIENNKGCIVFRLRIPLKPV